MISYIRFFHYSLSPDLCPFSTPQAYLVRINARRCLNLSISFDDALRSRFPCSRPCPSYHPSFSPELIITGPYVCARAPSQTHAHSSPQCALRVCVFLSVSWMVQILRWRRLAYWGMIPASAGICCALCCVRLYEDRCARALQPPGTLWTLAVFSLSQKSEFLLLFDYNQC